MDSKAAGVPVTASPPATRALTEVGSAYTVSLSSNGAVRVLPGLAGADASVDQRAQASKVAAAPLPALDPAPAKAPVVGKIEVFPEAARFELPAGSDVLLAPDVFLTLRVTAKSPERVPLFCEWKADKGEFSLAGPSPMKYLADSGEWEAQWQWTPPEGAVTGEKFAVKGTISDGYGHVTAVGGTATSPELVVEIGRVDQTMAYTTSYWDSEYWMYTVNSDGTDLRRVVSHENMGASGVFSADGQRVVFQADHDEDGQALDNMEVWICYRDGSGLRSLAPSSGNDSSPAWSPDGTRVAFVSDRDGNDDVWVVNADGSNLRNLTSRDGYDGASPLSWSPDGQWIVFSSNFADQAKPVDLWKVRSDGSAFQQLTFDGAQNPVCSSSGRIGYISTKDGQHDLYWMDSDGSNVTRVTNDTDSENPCAWSTDGQKLAFQSYARCGCQPSTRQN